MLITLDGIVLARREIGENSCYIDILTDERGLIEATAHGAKKINSSLLSSASLFSYSTFCLNKNKMRYTVNSAKPKFGFHELGSDIEKLALASYFAQAMRFCTPAEQDQLENRRRDSVVRFLAVTLYEVLRVGKSPLSLETIKAAFELRYSAILGFAPNLVACDKCGGFEPECGMYFLPRKAKLVCADCYKRGLEDEFAALYPETLLAMRDSVFAKLDELYKMIRISGDAEKQFSKIAEDYFLYGAERTFTALEYYKKVRVTKPH